MTCAGANITITSIMPDTATRRDLPGGAMACDASVQHAPREESKDRSRWRRRCYRARAHYHVSTRLSGHQQRQPVSDLHPPLPTRSRTGHKGSPAPAGCSVTPLARGSHDAAWPNFGRKIAVVANKSRTESTNNGGRFTTWGAVAHFRRHQRVFSPSLSLF